MFNPKIGRNYYCPDILDYYDGKYRKYKWSNDKYDNMLLERRLVCETAEEAEKLYDLLIEFLEVER